MFEGLFGAEEDDTSTWDSAPVVVTKGSKAPTPSRSSKVPFIGFANQGATCYLNSLLHALYFTPEFRQGLYSLKEEDLVVDENGRKEEPSGELPGNNPSTPATAQVDDSMSSGDASQLDMLIGMGFDESRVRKALRKFPSDEDPACERKMEWILEGGDDEDENELLNAMMGQEDYDSSPTGANQVDQSTSQADPNSGASDSNPAAYTSDKDATNGIAADAPKKKVREVPQALQQLFGILEKGNVAYASTEALTHSFGWKASHTSVQHDVHELSRVLMDVVERSLRGTPKSTLVRSLFHGTQCHQIKCLQCGMVKERSEEFGDLTLAIPRGAEYEAQAAAVDSAPKHGKNTRAANRAQAKANDGPGTSLEACLAHYFGLEYLNGKNQYECDACATRTDAEIGMRMKHLPRVLCLSLARMEYNFTTGQRVKNTGKVSFPPSIDLSPYLAERSTTGASNAETEAESSTVYDLYTVIVHKGQTATSGHYTVYVKDIFDLSHGNAGELNADDSDDEEGSSNKSDSNKKDDSAAKSKKKKASHVEGGAAWARLEAHSDAQRLAGVSPDVPLPAELMQENSVWYHFDDTRVARVSARSLPKVFSSSECAYMFFYRQRETVPTAELLDANISDHPAQLDTYLESFNKELADAREAYEKEINEITLELVTPSHLCALIPASAKPHIINKNTACGPPTFRWIEDEIKNGRLKLDETSAPQLTPITLKFDQRRTMSELMDELTSVLNESGEGSLGQPSESTLLMSLARTHHEKVLLERSFSIQRSSDTGIWTVKREEKEVMPSSKSIAELVASSDSDSLAKASAKSLTFAKAQRVVIWDGIHFPIQALLQTDSAPPAAPTSSLLLGPQEALPFFLQAPYSTARIRLYHAEKLTLPLSEASLAAQAADPDTVVATASETLRQLYGDSANDFEIMASWNDVCEGNISVEAINTPNPYGPASYVTTLALQAPATLPLSRALELCQRSLLVQSLIGPVDAPIKLLQPNLGSEGTQGVAIGAFGITGTLADLEKDVETIKLQRWNERMEAEQAASPGDHVSAENVAAAAALIDDTCGVILALDAQPAVPLVDDSYMLEVVAAIEGASSSNEQAYDEAEHEEEEEGTAAADGSKSKTGNKKKKRALDFYVILSLKMPKSAFYIRKESDKTEAEESSLSTRLALNAPLPDDDKAASPFTEASQYHPRYIIRSVPEDETLRDLVKRVYNVSGLAQPPRLPMHSRLYSTDAFEQRDRIFDNFNVTIKQAQISSYTTLWLEEGDEPRPGLLQLSTKLFRLAPNKLAVDVTENPLLRPVPTLRANLLFLPLPLSSFFVAPPAVTAPPTSDVGAGDGLPPPPPPPPLPPTATAFLLEVTQQSTLSELKDALAVHIEDHVRELWRAELKKRRESGTLDGSAPEVPSLAFFYEFFPFDFFLADNIEDKRRCMNLWIDDQIMVDDSSSATSLPLRSWRLNSCQRCNIAVLLTQTLPKHPVQCIELTSLPETGLSFKSHASAAELSMATPPALAPEESRKMTSLFTFIRGRHSEVPTIDDAAADSSSEKPASKVPSLVDSGQYGDLTMLWVTVPTATSTKPPAGKAKGKGKAPVDASKEPGAGHVPHQAPAVRHAHLATHALVDLDALVHAFGHGLVPSSNDDASEPGRSDLVPAIPPEWLLLARVGMMPHHHGMPLPKWQLIWRPTAFVQAEEASQSTQSTDKPAESDGEKKSDAPAAEKPKVVPTDEYGLGADDSAFANRNYVLMKHLQDKKIPGCEITPDGFALPSPAKKVKLLHGDTLVFADARTWAKNGLHEDVFWDEQRRRGLGSAEDAFMSDLEKALLESANMASRSRYREEALTIDVDF